MYSLSVHPPPPPPQWSSKPFSRKVKSGEVVILENLVQTFVDITPKKMDLVQI